MYCPRLDHFVRFNPDGGVSRCGHMTKAPSFKNLEEMQHSEWQKHVGLIMSQGQWPQECARCRQSEQIGAKSVREASIDRHRILAHVRKDYLILGGILDNICNSACQSCSSQLSTKIGSLENRNYIKINNAHLLDHIPWDRVVELDINGGEPTASPVYQKLLANLPSAVKIVRVNTNGSRMLPGLEQILQQGTKVIITLSLDGVAGIHDYVRWPISWDNYVKVVDQYLVTRQRYPQLDLQAWTTLHALNAADLPNIKQFCDRVGLDHSWAFLQTPKVLDARLVNRFTQQAKQILQQAGPEYSNIAQQLAIQENNESALDQFISHQDQLRNISIGDYL